MHPTRMAQLPSFFQTPTFFFQRRRRTFFSFLLCPFPNVALQTLSLVRTSQRLNPLLSPNSPSSFLSLVAHSKLTAALSITVPSQVVEAPGPISFNFTTEPTDPDSVPLITHLFNVSNSVNTSFLSYVIGSEAARAGDQFLLNGTTTFNLPPLPEGCVLICLFYDCLLMWLASSGGWVITLQLLTQTGGTSGGQQLSPILATSNTFSVTPAPKRFAERFI